MTRVRGHIETVSRTEVRGWAFDDEDPARLLPIEVVIAGRRVAIGQADQERQDLAGLGIGRVNCGFAIPLPANTMVDLSAMEVRAPGTTETLPVSDSAGHYEGVFEKILERTLSGWAWRCGFPTERVRILVRHRGEVAASGYADDLRGDLADAGVGDGRHGFMITLRVVEPPFQPETITVEFEATGGRLADLRPAGHKPAPPEAPPPTAPPRPKNLFVQRKPAATTVPDPPPVAKPPPLKAETPPAVRPQPAAEAVQPPPPPAHAPKPGYRLSREAYEALRGALDFGGDDGGLP